MAWIWIISISILFLYLLQELLLPLQRKIKINLPPGPKALPILGHFHLLGKKPHENLCRLAQKYGPIMYAKFGSVPIIVVSSPAAAELFLKTYDHVFCDRPRLEAARYLSYGQKNIVFGKYGPYWRNMRKLCTLELLTNLKIKQFRPMRKAEVDLFVGSLKRAGGGGGAAVDMSARITNLSADMICSLVFGKKYDGDRDLSEKGGLKAVVKMTMEEAGAFNIGDYFPYLRFLDLQGSARRLKVLSKIFDKFLEKIIDEHVANKKEYEEEKDFVDTMMEIIESGKAGFEFDRRNVKAVLLDMLLAGMDTSAATIEWTLSEVIRHPHVMKKLQKEVEEVVGMDQMVEESHLHKLKYLDSVVKETFRLHPVGPFLIHESVEDCVVQGFNIPKQSRIVVNVWAIGRDPNVWTDPESFAPERFHGTDIDLRGHDFMLIPFGSGRRGCPGLQLGLTVIQLVVAQLVHCFDWHLPNGMSPSSLDMTEHLGLVTVRANHLIAIPTYRLIEK
ncbi:cytochrome P450 71AU50-like [Henckelia pumila]|uniref:cytochrome P450 71AU50-like n=1 Tax=Henckelia pumila TaxID=405737 RepID=UPI003C6DFB4D